VCKWVFAHDFWRRKLLGLWFSVLIYENTVSLYYFMAQWICCLFVVFILILHETAYLSVFLNKNTSVQTKCYFVFYPLISWQTLVVWFGVIIVIFGHCPIHLCTTQSLHLRRLMFSPILIGCRNVRGMWVDNDCCCVFADDNNMKLYCVV